MLPRKAELKLKRLAAEANEMQRRLNIAYEWYIKPKLISRCVDADDVDAVISIIAEVCDNQIPSQWHVNMAAMWCRLDSTESRKPRNP